MMSCSGKLLSEKLDALRLTFYTGPISALTLLPFYARLESGRFAEYAEANVGSHYGAIVLLTCIVALSYNVVHYQVIKHTSAVS